VESRLAGFACLLRQNGLPVSPGEVVDAARAVALVGVETPDALRGALRATMVKRAADVPRFERLFALWFSPMGGVLDRLDRRAAEDLKAALGGADALEHALGAVWPLARAALLGDRAAVARLLARASLALDLSALANPSQVAFYARRLVAAAGGCSASRDLADLLSPRLAAAIAAVEDAARRWIAVEQRARATAREADRAPLLALAAPSAAERERTEAAVRALAERLRARLRRREKARRRGRLDVRRTLRRGLATGGVPARLVFRRVRPVRPDVVVLCDVSDSVRHVARAMLLFVHALQGAVGRVRSFVFISDVAEVTAAFEGEPDFGRAVERALGGALQARANSNYGRALRAFRDRHLAAVTHRTTVLVIGDGRTNYHPPHAEVLREVRRRARRVLWICPEERAAWGEGDSEMHAYAACVDRVAVLARVDDLPRVADELVPR
jgi:uncharacterized protein with von Willebrand factor type A (vWA) domain